MPKTHRPPKLDISQEKIAQGVHALAAAAWEPVDNRFRVTSLDETPIAGRTVLSVVGIPAYLDETELASEDYAAYNLTNTGWYVFARIEAREGTAVDNETTVTGAAGYIAEIGENHVDVAVRFGVAAEMRPVLVSWGEYEEEYVFAAPDLGIRNMDYRVTFYNYDIAPFAVWSWKESTDATFQEGKRYYTKSGDEYTLAEVTAGQTPGEGAVYYVHDKITFSGMTRNVTYTFDELVDCTPEFILPEITDETHGCWFQVNLLMDAEHSTQLVRPSADIRIANEHTQKEKKGINTIMLQYIAAGGDKVWRFLNQVSTFD